jgi:hypothetical protein
MSIKRFCWFFFPQNTLFCHFFYIYCMLVCQYNYAHVVSIMLYLLNSEIKTKFKTKIETCRISCPDLSYIGGKIAGLEILLFRSKRESTIHGTQPTTAHSNARPTKRKTAHYVI